MADLVTDIAHGSVELLNSTDLAERILKQGYRDDAALTVASDCDAEMLLHIPFNGRVARMTGIVINSNNPQFGPRRVKLFVNEPTIDFGQASSSAAKPAFEFELDEASLGKKDAVVALPVVKFRNVHTVSVFIESNQSGDDESTTVVSRIQLFGQSGDSFDVAAIKDVSKEEGS